MAKNSGKNQLLKISADENLLAISIGIDTLVHAIKPDHDNVWKFYSDCMNKIVFLDDSQIVGSDRCGKHWVPFEKQGWVEIRIEILNL